MIPRTAPGADEEQQAGNGTDIAGLHSRNTADRECSGTTVKMLSTEIDKSILRGVSSRVLIRRCGSAFRGHEFNAANYEESFEAASLDDFVSHDWASGALGKLLALCLIYNGLPAAAISLAVGVLVAVLESRYVGFLPGHRGPIARGSETLAYGYWCQTLCPVVYAIFFFTWQDVRAALRLGTRKAFLDKYCIDQTDVERKAAGILGLGGFLRHTDRFIICWTPRYFTRLWCTYEVASWLFLDKPLSSVLFMPLSHAQSICVGMVATTGACSILACGARFAVTFAWLVFAVATAIVLTVATHFWRRSTREIQHLPRQLEEFRVTNAACFCCSNGHKAPDNPAFEIPCDRRLVYHTLAHWFPTQVQRSGSNNRELGASELEAFDSAMRGLFGPWVIKSAGPTRIPYKYVVLMSMPFAFRMLDVASSIGRNSNTYVLKHLVALYPASIFAMIPTMYKLSLHVVCIFESCMGTLENKCLDVVATLCLALLFILMCAALWIPINVVSAFSEGPLPPLVIAILLFFFAALMFADEWADIMPSRLRRCFCGVTRKGQSPRELSSQEPSHFGSVARMARWQLRDFAEEAGFVLKL